MGGQSHFLFFYDQAVSKNSISGKFATDFPLGIGTGLKIDTDAGILSLIYALGADQSQTLNFKYAKIHFGFATLF